MKCLVPVVRSQCSKGYYLECQDVDSAAGGGRAVGTKEEHCRSSLGLRCGGRKFGIAIRWICPFCSGIEQDVHSA